MTARARRRRGCERTKLPIARELACAPELAILGAIEHALAVANVALVAAQPELGPRADGRDVISTAAAEAASRIIDCGRALAVAIEDYRAAALAEDHELPF